MRRDRQRGMTLVELLVAMAVASILMVGLANVLFNVTSRYQEWGHRLDTASVGVGLAATLQADVHRYVRCDATPLGQRLSVLQFCAADATSSPVVAYQVSLSKPYVISRQPAGQPPTFLVRSSGDTRPSLWVDCLDSNGTVSGHVHVYDLRLPEDSLDATSPLRWETFSVYYVAPRGTRGC